jgi:hypothetical protein
VMTSLGGATSASVIVAENTKAVTTVTATDADGTSPTYAIAGGVDAAKFTINAASGALSFVSAPDYDAPADAGHNNVYDVVVRATDGSYHSDQALAVTVTGVNDVIPTITSNGGGAGASIRVAENTSAVTTVTAADSDSAHLTYAIAGGSDAIAFKIDPQTGSLVFADAPNFEAPRDADQNNVYNVVLSASDGEFVRTQALAISVDDVFEPAPIISPESHASTALPSAIQSVTIACGVDDGSGWWHV